MKRPSSRSILLLPLAACVAVAVARPADPPASAPESPPPPAAETPKGSADEKAPPARVIIRESRNAEYAGYVEFEDDDVIIVRTVNDKLISFAKSRVVAIVLLVPPGPPRRGTVILRNGMRRDGIVIEDEFSHVVLEIEGVRARFKRETVDHVRLKPTILEQYEYFKSRLDPGSAGRHFELCSWLVEQREYALAKEELETLLRNHDFPPARRLLRVVEAQLALQVTDGEQGEQPKRPDVPDPERAVPLPAEFITAEDVNLIRVYEVDFERPPKVSIPSQTISTLITTYQSSPLMPASREGREALYAADPVEVLQLMFRLRARELYPEVQVVSEPYSLNLFRQRVHDTWLMNNCTTSRCHGGPDAGPFFLYRRDYKDARVRYTNLLILERLEVDPEWRLVNYQSPLDSLIIQYALAPAVARRPHPTVPGWKPVFRRTTDRMVKDAVRWIESMLEPRPEYPIEFKPPVIEGQAQPGRADR